MFSTDDLAIVRHLEGLGVNIVRGGFATWVRDELGFQASDEHVARAMERVQSLVAEGRPSTVHDLTATIALEMHASSHIDAFGGSAWAMD